MIENNKIIRWGILGTGKIAHKFADEISLMTDCKITAIASSTAQQKAQTFAQKYSIENAFGSYKEMYISNAIDVIYIATPHTLHHPCAIEALMHGKAVLCEKPFAMNGTQVMEMIAASKSYNVFLMEAMWSAFMPALLHVKEIISHGVIGEVKSISADFGFLSPYIAESRLWKKSLGGGALLDIGIYPVFLSLYLMGYPEKIHAVSRFNHDKVDISTNMIFEYENNAISRLSCHLDVDTSTDAYIFGTKAYIRICARFHESREIIIGNIIDGKDESIRFERGFRGFTYQVQEVNDCLRKGKLQSDVMSHDLSLQLIRLLDVCRAKAGIL